MDDQQTITALRRAADAAVRDRRLGPGAAAAAWSAAHTRRRRGGRRLAIAASVLVTAAAASAVGLWAAGRQNTTAPAGRSACAGNVTTAPLPAWARAGFTGAGLRTPHVISARGEIIAVLFVPLRVHQPAGTHNKVLWVAKSGYGPMHISARLQGTSQTVSRDLPNGPGPSYVDMPAAGCWQMSLTWSGLHDSIALQYRP